MAAPTKDQVTKDKRIQKAWVDAVVHAERVDPRDELHWESLWTGFVIGKGRPDLATYTHYLRLGFPAAMERPPVAAAAAAAAAREDDDR